MTRRTPLAAVTGALALLLAAGTSACSSGGSSSGGSSSSSTSRGGTLTILTTAPSVHLDPATSQSLATTSLGLIARRLTTWKITPGHAAQVVPDLATTTGTPSDGGKTWTYTLKKGVDFQDGTAITSSDIKYGVERSFAPQLTGGLAYHKSLLVGGDTYQGPYTGGDLASIETPDARTIVFHLDAAYGDWPWIASMPAFTPVPKAKDDPNTYDTHPVASGPYEVASDQQGSQLVLKRNPHWSRSTDPVRTAGPNSIVFKESQDSDTTTQTLIADTGSAQTSFGASYLGASDLNLVRQNTTAAARLATSQAGPINYLGLNTTRGPLKILKVRQAIEYATDKRAFRVAQGGTQAGQYASTLITPGIAGRKSYDLYKAPASGDVSKAKSLLAAAGQSGGFSVDLLTMNEPQYVAEAQALQQGLKRVGITVTLKPVDDDTYATEASTQDDYDMVLGSWQPDFPSANANISPLFASSQIGGGGYNLSHFSDPAVDALISQASATVDQGQAQALWAKADKMIMAQAPVVPLTYARQSFLRGSEVEGFSIADFPAYPDYLTTHLGQ